MCSMSFISNMIPMRLIDHFDQICTTTRYNEYIADTP